MGLYTKLPDNINEVDVIIAGGGTAGCIIAGRLAEADPDLSILLIESGPNNYEDPAVVIPAFWLSHMDPRDKYVRTYTASRAHKLAQRELLVPTSRVLGGGSSINTLIYSRPQRSEIDAWQTPGWSADEVLTYMNKLESFHGPGSQDRHGNDGPISITSGYCSQRLADDFIKAINSAGWPEFEDINNLDTVNGVQRMMRYVKSDGKRADVAHAYLHPKLQGGKYPNLHVLVETDVERVLFDDSNKRAVGVAFRPCTTFQPGTESDPVRVVSARRMVVISGGALGSPQILERSGVGHPEVLAEAGVPVTASVPGVGESYQDHQIMTYPYKTTAGPDETMDGVLGGLMTGTLDLGGMLERGDPLLGWNAVDMQCKLRPSDADVAGLGPEFQTAWGKEFKNYPDKPMTIMSGVSAFPGDPSPVPPGQYMGIATFILHPFSRGRFHISGPSIKDEPVLDTGFWAENDLDLKQHMWMYKKSREIVRRMETFDGEVAVGHPSFPSGSKASVVEAKITDVQDIEYTPEDDKAIEAWLRGRIACCWHSLGTCKMAPLDQGGVVDPELNVHGVKGLKVADLSILPGNVGANTCNIAMAVGEKAADLVARDLGLVVNQSRGA